MRTSFLLLLPFFFSTPAEAALINFEYTATVTSVFEHSGATEVNTFVDSSAMTGSPFSLGDVWKGTVIYDDKMPLSPFYQPPQPTNATYLIFRGDILTTLSNDQTQFSYQSSVAPILGTSMQVQNSQPGTGWDNVYFETTATYSTITSQMTSFRFYDYDGTALTGPNPPASFDLSRFETKSVEYGFSRSSDSSQMHATATITSIGVQSVPEPSTLALLFFGLAGVYRSSKNAKRLLHK